MVMIDDDHSIAAAVDSNLMRANGEMYGINHT